ncbi:uncharacterized protein LOC127722390 [Mytilus californianus]|uniref:uncharacterized protein LOC127722390 n=1 Tax=Mytilus californianus TaxID=6549 RepID=UPI002246B6B0|nr:uncharacterized protein LOC127722390 [Mytilus californianus]
MAKSHNDTLDFRTQHDGLGKENYDRLLSVFHTGTDVKRSLLEQYLREKHLNLLDWLTDLNQTFLKFDDIKRAIKRSSTINLKDLELSTIDILLKFNCFDLFWDVCLLNTRLEEILNSHKEELLGIYQNSIGQHGLPSLSTEQYTPSLTKKQWEILFKSGESCGIKEEGNAADISATKDITLSNLDETLNVLLLYTVCPLFQSVNTVSECQIQISKIAVLHSECERFAFENLWNRIESHIISIAAHCKLSGYFKRKCEATKQTFFNKTLSQENRKCILEDAFNNPDFIRNKQFCNRVRKELDLITMDDNLNLARKLCGKEIPILLVDGKYTKGAYSLSLVENADEDLQVMKSVCSNQVMEANQNETEDDMQADESMFTPTSFSHSTVSKVVSAPSYVGILYLPSWFFYKDQCEELSGELVMAQQLLKDIQEEKQRLEVESSQVRNAHEKNILQLGGKRFNGFLGQDIGHVTKGRKMCKRELEKCYTDGVRDAVIIAEYKQICSQLSERLVKQQTANKEEIGRIKGQVRSCDNCSKMFKDDEKIELPGQKVDSHSLNSQYLDLQAQTNELQLELAQTKLALVESECKSQDLTHQLNSTITELQSSNNTWFQKTINSLTEVTNHTRKECND